MGKFSDAVNFRKKLLSSEKKNFRVSEITESPLTIFNWINKYSPTDEELLEHYDVILGCRDYVKKNAPTTDNLDRQAYHALNKTVERLAMLGVYD